MYRTRTNTKVCCCCCLCVSERELAIVNQCGRYESIRKPGLSYMNCCCGSTLGGIVSLRVRQLNVSAETKTIDNVFVTLRISIQYQISQDNAYEAFYRMVDPERQIGSYVCDVIRSTVPKLKIDQVFETKQDIAHAVREELSKTMDGLGYIVKEALVTDIELDRRVKDAMNEINASQRMRMATLERAEAEKLLAVKTAQAEAESKHLTGVGIARQRKAIADGLRESVSSFTGSVAGSTSSEIMDMLLVTQYFDTLKELGEHSASSTIFIPHNPGSVANVARQIRIGTGTQLSHELKVAAASSTGGKTASELLLEAPDDKGSSSAEKKTE